MKKKALAAAVLAAVTMSATTAFAAQNPFKDLPQDHWAYDAVTMLAKDGVLEGYGDGSFRGDKLMNRYEMAEVVAKALANYDGAKLADKGVMKKLEREFANELKDMDVRLQAVENDVQDLKNKQSSFKWFGDARMRASRNLSGVQIKGGNFPDGKASEGKEAKKIDMRLRLGLYGEPAPNLSVTGQLKLEDENLKSTNLSGATTNSGTHNALTLNRLELAWNAKNQFKVSAGRMWQNLGQGLIWWENPMDGVAVEKGFGDKASLRVGYADLAPENWSSESEYAFFANAKAKISPAVEVTAAYLGAHSDKTISNYYDNNWGASWHNYANDGKYATNYEFGFASLGVNAQLADKWNLIVEGVHNTRSPRVTDTTGNPGAKINKHDNGLWTRLTYGKMDWSKANTWQAYGEYFALGGTAIDSSGWGHRLNIAGGNGYGGYGARGWGLGVGYMVANNTNLELTYYRLSPYDSANAPFDRYEDTAYASLSYSF